MLALVLMAMAYIEYKVLCNYKVELEDWRSFGPLRKE